MIAFSFTLKILYVILSTSLPLALVNPYGEEKSAVARSLANEIVCVSLQSSFPSTMAPQVPLKRLKSDSTSGAECGTVEHAEMAKQVRVRKLVRMFCDG